MAASVGKFVVGGAAVYLSYRLSNSTIEGFSERRQFSERKLAERMKQRPRVTKQSRRQMLERVEGQKFDVVVVGGDLRSSSVSLDCARAGLNTLVIDSEDFNSTQPARSYKVPAEIGTFSFLKSLYSDENLSLSEKILALPQGTAEFSYLKTAPHLTTLRTTEVVAPDLISCVLEFLANKLSEISINKPPQFTSRLISSSAPPWYPQAPLLSYRVTEVLTQPHRLNLSLVLTAVQHGAAALNHAEVKEVERGEDVLTLSLEDKLTGSLIQVNTRKLLRLNRRVTEDGEKTHCFSVPGGLLEDGGGLSLPGENIVISREAGSSATVCVGSCLNHREAFQRLRSAISKVLILRRSEVSALPVVESKRSDWTVETCDGETSSHSDLSPLSLPPQGAEPLLLGSHGWSPHLSSLLHTRYGLSLPDSHRLASSYGDLAIDIARAASREGTLAAEVRHSCDFELCVSLQGLCNRLRLRHEDDINLAASIMQKQLGWSNSLRDRQVKQSLNWVKSMEELDQWKQSPADLEDVEFSDERFDRNQIKNFKALSREDGTISQGELEDYLAGQDSPCPGRALTEAQLDTVLREVDIEQNGKYSQSEFLSIVKRIHVLTPEEVIADHVHQLQVLEINKQS